MLPGGLLLKANSALPEWQTVEAIHEESRLSFIADWDTEEGLGKQLDY